jgi:hypothetical protein
MSDKIINILSGIDYSKPFHREIYRYRESTFFSGNGIATKSSWTLMKRKSKLTGDRLTMIEMLKEVGEPDAYPINIEGPPPEDGQLYICTTIKESKDYETGVVDDWEYLMTPYEEE